MVQSLLRSLTCNDINLGSDLMCVHDLTRAAKANNSSQRHTARQRRKLTGRVVCILLTISLLFNSTPAAAQTIVSVTNDSMVSFAFWLETSGSLSALKRLLSGNFAVAIR